MFNPKITKVMHDFKAEKPIVKDRGDGVMVSSLLLFHTEDKTAHLGHVINKKSVDSCGCSLDIWKFYDAGGNRWENVTQWVALNELR